jgi:hypothetical protein
MNLRGKATIKFAILISVASWITPNEGNAQPMCGTTPAPAHNNGVGGTYHSCLPLGAPGNLSTYNQSMAQEAALSWQPNPANVSSAQCGIPGRANTPQVVLNEPPNSCAVWAYTGPAAGHVHLNTADNNCLCPTTSDPTWN